MWLERVVIVLAVLFGLVKWSSATVAWTGLLIVASAALLDRYRVTFPHYGFTSAAPALLLAAGCSKEVGVGFAAVGLALLAILRLQVSPDLLPGALAVAVLASGKAGAWETGLAYALVSLLHPLLRSKFFPRLPGRLAMRTWGFHLLGAAVIVMGAMAGGPLLLLPQLVVLVGAISLVRSQRGMNIEDAHRQEARQLQAEQMKEYLLLIDAMGYSLHNQAEPSQVLEKVAQVMVSSSRADLYALMERDGPRWRLVSQKGVGEKLAVERFQKVQGELPRECRPLSLKTGWVDEESAMLIPWEGEAAIYLGRTSGNLESAAILERLARMGAAALRTAHEKAQRRELGDYKSELERLYAELKQAHLDLEQSQSDLVQAKKLAAVGQLAAGVAHELNSPFQAIAVHLDLVRGSLEDPDDLECVDTIGEALERCRVIVRELLQFSRRSSSPPQELKVADVLRSACVAAGVKGVSVECDAELMLRGQEHELVSLFTNLLGNARDAVEGAPQENIRIRASGRGEQVRIVVEDRGCGMPESVRERIFEPFYTTKEVGSGTGLGMYMVYTYVTNAGGEIEVKSEEGKGTSVAVTLSRGG